MIPKILHYCWFGRGEKSKLIKKCIKSWKKYCPDYEVIEWNEDNFDIDGTLWTKQAYAAEKWAFVSDYVRLYALYNFGGIYLDTDQELLKPLDVFLTDSMFLGYASSDHISMGVLGCEKGNETIKLFLNYYNGRSFNTKDGFDLMPNGTIMSGILKEFGFAADGSEQTVLGCHIFPRTYFSPTNYDDYNTFFTASTYSVHHFDSSWRSAEAKKAQKRAKFHSTAFYRIYEQIAAYPIAAYKKIFKRS